MVWDQCSQSQPTTEHWACCKHHLARAGSQPCLNGTRLLPVPIWTARPSPAITAGWSAFSLVLPACSVHVEALAGDHRVGIPCLPEDRPCFGHKRPSASGQVLPSEVPDMDTGTHLCGCVHEISAFPSTYFQPLHPYIQKRLLQAAHSLNRIIFKTVSSTRWYAFDAVTNSLGSEQGRLHLPPALSSSDHLLILTDEPRKPLKCTFTLGFVKNTGWKALARGQERRAVLTWSRLAH